MNQCPFKHQVAADQQHFPICSSQEKEEHCAYYTSTPTSAPNEDDASDNKNSRTNISNIRLPKIDIVARRGLRGAN